MSRQFRPAVTVFRLGVTVFAISLTGLLVNLAAAQDRLLQPFGLEPEPQVPFGPPPLEALPAPAGPPPPAVRMNDTGVVSLTDGPTLDLVEFREMPLSEAVRILTDQTGLKIVPTSNAAQVNVSLYLRDVRPMVALDALTKAHGLVHRRDPETEIIRIYTVDEFEADLAAFVEEQTEVFTLLYPNPLDVAFAIRDLYGDRVVLNLEFTDQIVFEDLMQRFGRYNLVNTESAQGFGLGASIGGVGAGFGGIGMGLGMGPGFGVPGMGLGMGLGATGMQRGFMPGGMGPMRGMGMVDPRFAPGVQQLFTPQPFPVLEDLTAEQIQRLEAAREEADTQAARQAIDELLRRARAHIFLSVIRRQNQLIVRTADPEIMDRIRELVFQLDVPTPLVLLEVKVLSLELGDSFNSMFDYQFSDGQTTAGQFTTGDILPPPSDAVTGPQRRTTSMTPQGGGLDTNRLIFQIVNDKFRARLQLLENKNRVTELATPMLLTANNEVSRIFIGQTIPVTVGFTPPTVVAGAVTAPVSLAGSPITQLQDVGQSLIVTPNINADRTVTLRIGQQNSRLVINGAVIPVPTTEGTIVQQPIDTVQRTSITGTVVAKDGLTVAIGGLIEDSIFDTRAQVPVVGKLPGIGFFFRRQETGRSRSELIVLIRPYIFNTPQESALLSSELIPELSLHPRAVAPVGTMESFGPQEVVRADPPTNPLQTIFRFHSVDPKVY